jgi:hypothetical protein
MKKVQCAMKKSDFFEKVRSVKGIGKKQSELGRS